MISCTTCRNYAWAGPMMRPVSGVGGLHHPSCSRVASLGAYPMFRPGPPPNAPPGQRPAPPSFGPPTPPAVVQPPAVTYSPPPAGTVAVAQPAPGWTFGEKVAVVSATLSALWVTLYVFEWMGMSPKHRATQAAAKKHPLSYRHRQALPSSSFALPARRALPLEDAAHVRAAAARLSMMRHNGHVTRGEYLSAHRRIVAAGRRFGVHVR